jgi:hypothetical protein
LDSPFGLGQRQRTFSIITAKANRLIEPIHERMPVVLDERGAEDWMNPNESDPLRLKSLSVLAQGDRLVLSPASLLVNSVKNDGPELPVPYRTLPVSKSVTSLVFGIRVQFRVFEPSPGIPFAHVIIVVGSELLG